MTRKTYTGLDKLESGTQLRDVTPDDNNDLDLGPCRGFIVAVAGNVNVIAFGDDTAVVLPSMVAGVVHPVAVKRILSTSTTATGIVAVY